MKKFLVESKLLIYFCYFICMILVYLMSLLCMSVFHIWSLPLDSFDYRYNLGSLDFFFSDLWILFVPVLFYGYWFYRNWWNLISRYISTISAEVSLVICDTCKKVQAILDRIEETKNLKTIVVIEKLSVELKSKAEQLGVSLITFTQLEVCIKEWLRGLTHVK